MFKKLLILGACALLAGVSALYSAPAQATTGYYFVSSCGNSNPRECPSGPNPIWFGPYNSYEECDAAWEIYSTGWFGTYPRDLSSCFPA